MAATNQISVQGITPSVAESNLNAGDAFTGLITLYEKGGRQTQWLLYLRALPASPIELARKPPRPTVLYSGSGTKFEFAPSPALVELQTLGPFSESQGKTKAAAPQPAKARFAVNQGFLGLGLDQGAATIYRLEQANTHGSFWLGPKPPSAAQIAEFRKTAEATHITTEEERAVGGMLPALLSYFEIVGETEGLEDIMMKVIRKPSVWSVVGHLGVSVNLSLDSKHVGPADSAAWNVPEHPPAYYFPMLLEINNKLALTVTFVVTRPHPPLLTCGGIIGMLAEKPGDKETYLTLRIISARRATARTDTPDLH
jgi:hypothetical protein